MGKPLSADSVKLQDKNWASFEKWLKDRGKVIMPIPGKSIVYGGYPKSNVYKGSKKVAKETPDLERMWQVIERVESQEFKRTGYDRYDTLSEVLQRTKGEKMGLVETTGANIGDPKKFSDLLDNIQKLTSDKWQLLQPKFRKKVWDRLSVRYIQNSSGVIEIWSGNQKDGRKLDANKFTLISDELKAILANDDIAAETKKIAVAILKRYKKFHDDLDKEMTAKRSGFKKGLLVASKK